jgi:hypothetical protein
MKRAFRKFVILALLAWLPLQAAALPALAFLCEVDPGAMHGHAAAHSHHGDHQHGDGGHDTAAVTTAPLVTGRSARCCHHFFRPRCCRFQTVTAMPVSASIRRRSSIPTSSSRAAAAAAARAPSSSVVGAASAAPPVVFPRFPCVLARGQRTLERGFDVDQSIRRAAAALALAAPAGAQPRRGPTIPR